MLNYSQWLSYYRRFTRLGHLALGYTGSSVKLYQKMLKRKFLDKSRLDNFIREIEAQQQKTTTATTQKSIETYSPLLIESELLLKNGVGTGDQTTNPATDIETGNSQTSPQIERLVHQRLERTVQFMTNAAFSSLALQKEKEQHSENLKNYLRNKKKKKNKINESSTELTTKTAEKEEKEQAMLFRSPKLKVKEAFEYKLLGKLILIEKSNRRNCKPKKYNPSGTTKNRKSKEEEGNWGLHSLNYIVNEFNRTMDLWL